MDKTKRERRLAVDVPLLSPEQKAEYTAVAVSPESVSRDNIETIVGEYEEDDELYYYARFTDGVVHKVRHSKAYMYIYMLNRTS